jgi:hypothetical protein
MAYKQLALTSLHGFNDSRAPSVSVIRGLHDELVFYIRGSHVLANIEHEAVTLLTPTAELLQMKVRYVAACNTKTSPEDFRSVEEMLLYFSRQTDLLMYTGGLLSSIRGELVYTFHGPRDDTYKSFMEYFLNAYPEYRGRLVELAMCLMYGPPRLIRDVARLVIMYARHVLNEDILRENLEFCTYPAEAEFHALTC